MSNSPRDRLNRHGCLLILAVLGLFLVLYLLVGFNSEPGNSVASNIQTVPAPAQ